MVDVTDQTTAVTTAVGNSAAFSVEGGDMDVRANQTLDADVRANTLPTVTGSAGASTVLNTSATGNTSDGAVSGGVHTGVYNQRVMAGRTIYAHTHVEGPNAHFGDVSSSVQAIGNSQGIRGGSAAAGVRVNQTNDALVNSDGGGYLGTVTGTSTFSAASVANNVSLSGENAAQRAIIQQSNTAAVTQAAHFTAYGNAYISSTQASSTGNNIVAAQDGPIVDVTSQQQNLAYVRAQAVNSAAEFGAGSAAAYGVGNSLSAGNAGTSVVIDSDQFNDVGGVEAIAGFTGTAGYDGSSSAAAVGNAATGYACAECSGQMQVSNRQVNNAQVGSTSTASVTSGRSINGVATAVGNTASYYVSLPNR